MSGYRCEACGDLEAQAFLAEGVCRECHHAGRTFALLLVADLWEAGHLLSEIADVSGVPAWCVDVLLDAA